MSPVGGLSLRICLTGTQASDDVRTTEGISTGLGKLLSGPITLRVASGAPVRRRACDCVCACEAPQEGACVHAVPSNTEPR